MQPRGNDLSRNARRVQQALNRLGVNLEVWELPGSTRTSAQAAEAVGCSVDQIAKSLLFRGAESGKPVLVIASGSNRVDESLLSSQAGEPVALADAEYVRAHTGFAIGGVPPVGHPCPLETYIDRDLLAHEEVWAAAGTPRAVFRLSPQTLATITGGAVIPVN